jgi:hypothetical protein
MRPRQRRLADHAHGTHQRELIGDVPIAVAGFVEGSGRRPARIGDEDVEAAEFCNRLRHDSFHVGGPGHVGGGKTCGAYL